MSYNGVQGVDDNGTTSSGRRLGGEIAAHADELAGKRTGVSVEADAPPAAVQPNLKMLDAMRAAEEIQRGMNSKPGSDGVAIIREGRQRAMYGMPFVDDMWMQTDGD